MYCKPNFTPCAEVLEVCGLDLALPPSIALHILHSSGSVHPENHDKREPEVVEEGTSRKMRVAISLDMQYSMNNRHLEMLDLVAGERHKPEKGISGFEAMKLFQWPVLRCNLAE